MKIIVARAKGFCAGVSAAVKLVQEALERFGPPLYVFHEIVHNTFVVEEFRRQGVIFVEDLEEVPEGERVIFSAHGVAPSVLEKARQRRLRFVDATCPLVNKVHIEAVRFSQQNIPVILIGHRGHQELIGTMGYVAPHLLHIVETADEVDRLPLDPNQTVAYLTQTTLSLDDTQQIIARLKQRYPKLIGPPRSDICYATQNRQDAVKELAQQCDAIVVIGSPNSSNSNRLRETGERCGLPSWIIDDPDAFNLNLLNGFETVGLTSGASVPDWLLERLIERLCAVFDVERVVRYDNPEKNIAFRLPALDAMA